MIATSSSFFPPAGYLASNGLWPAIPAAALFDQFTKNRFI